MLIVNGVIQSNGQKDNVKKRSQLCVLACDILGPIAVPDSLPSLPHWISTSGQIACEIVSQASQLCVTKGSHLLRCSLPQNPNLSTSNYPRRYYVRLPSKDIMVYQFPKVTVSADHTISLTRVFLTKWRQSSYHSRKTRQKNQQSFLTLFHHLLDFISHVSNGSFHGANRNIASLCALAQGKKEKH